MCATPTDAWAQRTPEVLGRRRRRPYHLGVAAPDPSPIAAEARLNPAQQRVIDLLGRGAERAELPAGIGAELRAALEDELAPLADHLGDTPLWVSKHALATVHACEAHYAASIDDPFGWTPANARGIVAHRAIEILVH